VVASEIGFLMLFTETEERALELKATTVEGVLTTPAFHEAIHTYSRRALDEAQPVFSNKPEGPVHSIIAIPLILKETIIGVFGALNSRSPYGFSAEDRRVLQAITSQVDTAVFERLEQRRIRRALSRSVDPKVMEHLLKHASDTMLAGERVVLTSLFADLRGSTAWGERTDPEQLVSTLNRFLGAMTEVIFKYEGTLDKFVGDEVIALFGCPMPMDDHALRATRCAQEMQAVHARLQAELEAQGIELPPVGIGISTGEVIAGEIGSPVRTDFTGLGRVMNLGARLCSVAGPEEIVISSATHEATRDQIAAKEVDAVGLKGLGDVKAYVLTSGTD
jgi:adenylate cyclase